MQQLNIQEAKQRFIPTLLSTTKKIQEMQYKHQPLLKCKLPFPPLYEDGRDDTQPECIYYRLLGALELASNMLSNNIYLMLALCKEELVNLLKKMLEQPVTFVKAIFKHMDAVYKQLFTSFDDKVKTGELLSFCILEMFITEFKSAQELAIGFRSTKVATTGPCYVFSLLSLIHLVNDLLKTGIIIHLAHTESIVRFLCMCHTTEN